MLGFGLQLNRSEVYNKKKCRNCWIQTVLGKQYVLDPRTAVIFATK